MQNTRSRYSTSAITTCLQRTATNRGFTLLELIIVLFLVTLIIGLTTVYFFTALPSNKLNATARSISATIRQARALSQIQSERKVVTIDLDSRKYGIEGLGFRDIPSDISIKVTDPIAGEIIQGQYLFVVQPGGGIEGGIIHLWTLKKEIRLQTDPVTGTTAIQ
jgi:prepilin-type N-terminal cleavage/methylation domain-containing protein